MADIGLGNGLLVIGKNVTLHVSPGTSTSNTGFPTDFLSNGVAVNFSKSFPRVRNLMIATVKYSHEAPDIVLTGTIWVSSDLIEYIFDKQSMTPRGELDVYQWGFRMNPESGTGKEITFLGELEDIEISKTETAQGELIPLNITVLLTEGNLNIDDA